MSTAPDERKDVDFDAADALSGAAEDARGGEEPTLEEAKSEIENLKDRLLRALAEASNARNRAGAARSDGRKDGIVAAVEAMIPALDNFDLALKSAESHEAALGDAGRALLDGVAQTRRALIESLERLGVTRFDPTGKRFDPNHCEAISMREDASVEPNTVVETVQPGYRFEQRLIRPAFVIVSSRKNSGAKKMEQSLEDKKPPVIEIAHIREACGVIRDLEQLETAVDYLTAAGVDRADIDLMADRFTILRKLGRYYVDPAEAANDPGTPRRPLVLREDLGEGVAGAFGLLSYVGAIGAAGAVLASGGALAAAAMAAIAGGAASGGLGALFGRSLTQRQLDRLKFDLEGGGLVLFVRLRVPEIEEKVKKALADAGAANVFVHEIDLPRTVEDVPLHDINPDPWLGDERLGDVS